ncbi:MAG: hypothetical protein AABY86_07010 [Bdellovibrionota bacterium]
MVFGLRWIVVLMVVWGALAQAEYRVYQYFVKARMYLSYDAQSYMTRSTFDPVSFLAYHGGRDSISVELLNTWICKGHTGGKELCPSPDEAQGEVRSEKSAGSNP